MVVYPLNEADRSPTSLAEASRRNLMWRTSCAVSLTPPPDRNESRPPFRATAISPVTRVSDRLHQEQECCPGCGTPRATVHVANLAVAAVDVPA